MKMGFIGTRKSPLNRHIMLMQCSVGKFFVCGINVLLSWFIILNFLACSAEIPYIGYDWEAENLVVSMILVVFMCNDVSLHSSHFIIVKQFIENLDCVK